MWSWLSNLNEGFSFKRRQIRLRNTLNSLLQSETREVSKWTHKIRLSGQISNSCVKNIRSSFYLSEASRICHAFVHTNLPSFLRMRQHQISTYVRYTKGATSEVWSAYLPEHLVIILVAQVKIFGYLPPLFKGLVSPSWVANDIIQIFIEICNILVF